MSKKHDDNAPISVKKFMDELWRYKRGSVTRRHFLGVTGLGAATTLIVAAMPMLPGVARAGSIGDRVSLATWPNYFNPANFEAFKKDTGAAVKVSVFGSNEEMLAKLQAGGTGWDVFVPTNYTISTYVELDLIQPLDLSRLPNFDDKYFTKRFSEAGTVNGKVYAVPKNWGTTGFVVNRNKVESNPSTWKEFWDISKTSASGRVVVHDYQLTTIGNALKYFGYSFNSVDPKELADAEKLQVFREAWVMLRDNFYDPTFNHQDWSEVYDRYLPYVAGARDDYDLSYIINLMLGDLNASHLGYRYFAGGGAQSGDLGITFDPAEYLEHGRFKVEDVVPGGPVAVENSDLGVGSYLLAVNGVELGPDTNLAKLLERKIGKRVELTYSTAADAAVRKTVWVKPAFISSVNRLRYRRWVRSNEEYVRKISGGRLGYVHMINMGGAALEQFKLDLDSQVHGMEGVVIDVRYNTGGYVAPFVIDVLQRRTALLQSFRGRSRTSSENMAGNRILDKPTIVVQNEQSLSNAEMFAELYRRAGLGKIVGTESNGWVIWTWGAPLLNGAYLRLPRVAVKTLEGEDLDEASRRPDFYVERPIGQSLTGKDDQLDAAVRILLEQIDQTRR